jgi:hypothetical protein
VVDGQWSNPKVKVNSQMTVIDCQIPGILIESQDAEDAAYFCGCRAARATHPCPKCLVSHSELHEVSANFTLRTPTNMHAALEKVPSAKTKGEKERILVKYGLHDIPVCTFCFQL